MLEAIQEMLGQRMSQREVEKYWDLRCIDQYINY